MNEIEEAAKLVNAERLNAVGARRIALVGMLEAIQGDESSSQDLKDAVEWLLNDYQELYSYAVEAYGVMIELHTRIKALRDRKVHG